ncbi:MAG: hypothetical protein ACE15C_09325 [Phycisphaerae bacterium]
MMEPRMAAVRMARRSQAARLAAGTQLLLKHGAVGAPGRRVAQRGRAAAA